MEKFTIQGEARKFDLVNRSFDEFHGITMAFITLNEEKDIVGFLNHIKPYVDKIVMVDGGSSDKTIELATPLVDKIKIIPFDGHLGNQKNNAIALSRTDWTLFLDPDERLTQKALDSLRTYIEQDKYDCYSYPRREFLSGKENPSVYPDRQERLFRTYCRYVRPIHHELVGYKSRYVIPEDSGIELTHNKELDRHRNRNSGHNFFQIHYKHEMSYPGAQLKDTFTKQFPFYNDMVLSKGTL